MTSTRIQFIGALLLCLGALALYAYWYSNIVGESTEAAAFAESLSAKSALDLHKNVLSSILTELGSDQEMIQRAFVSDQTLVSFLTELEASASSTGATVSVGSVGGVKSATPALQVSLSLTGTFDQVVRSVGIIEYAPYALIVNNVALVQGQGDLWSATLTILVQQTTSAAPAPKPAIAP